MAVAASRKRVAALVSTYHVRSHADNIVTRILEGHWIGPKYNAPSLDVVALHMDQVHPADIGVRLGAAYGFPVLPSIPEALGRPLDGVVIVVEHGNYPTNEKNQHLYPRFEFFEAVVKHFRKTGRAAPVFVDKHLSYDWKKARQMYDWSRELRFPFMAGSSLPVTFRRPDLDYPLGVEFTDALMIGGGWVGDGGIFHDLETLQVFVERRKGGETGVRAVQQLEGDAVWKAAEQGLWPKKLMPVALARAAKPVKGRPEDVKNPVVCLIEYNDGFRAAVLKLGGMVGDYLIALQRKGKPEPDSTNCYIPTENSNNFSMLVHGMTEMFETGKTPFPIERTLLTTGTLSFLMESAYRSHRRIETPELKISYQAPGRSYYAPGEGS